MKRTPSSLKREKQSNGGQSKGNSQPWHRTPLRAIPMDLPQPNIAPVELTDIEIEDFGFDEVEIEPSQTRDGTLEQILELRDNVVNYEVPRYLDEFERAKEAESLLIGALSIDEIEAHENSLEIQRLQEAEAEAMNHAKKQAELAKIESEARGRLQTIWERHSREATARELQRVDAHNKRKMIMQQAFSKAEENLRVALERREAEVNTYYGDLTNTEALQRQLKGRHFALDWKRAPQPWELRIHALRGVRNKLPRGFYVLRVTIYDQISGKPLAWSRLPTSRDDPILAHEKREEHWNVATDPKRHTGGFEIDFQTSLHTASVAPIMMKPSMCLVFQLFQLKSTDQRKTAQVGWSAFPMCDSSFNPINGKFKVPMLRGMKDDVVDKYEEIEDIVKHDIDNWLGNLYFEARHLDRYIDGHREFDVELEFTSSLLDMSKENTHVSGQEWHDDKQERDKIDAEALLPDSPQKDGSPSLVLAHSQWLKSREEAAAQDKALPFVDQAELQALPPVGGGDLEEGSAIVVPGDDEILVPDEKKEGDERERFKMTEDVSFCFGRTIDEQERLLDEHQALVEARRRNEKHKRRVQGPWHEKISEYKYNLPEPIGSLEQRESTNKLAYVFRSLTKDLGLHRHPYFYRGSVWAGFRWECGYGSVEFWMTAFVFLVIWWIRMYVHYIGQYAYITGLGTSVSYFNIEAFMLRIQYQTDGLRPEKELGMVAMGPVSNMGVFLIFMWISQFSQWWLDYFPEHGCRFIAAYGIMTMLDPAWVAIVDVLDNNREHGDMYKMYNKFLIEEGSGVTGIFVTIIVYGLLMAFQAIVLFYYLLRVHMNGHMQDVYARLHGTEFCFFVPIDGEVSWKEVQYECRRAPEWRGKNGELRKVQVVDYEHKDRYDSSFKEKTTVTSIYTVQPKTGMKEIHRQFVRLPQGCIIERFGTERMDLSFEKKRGRRNSVSGAYGVLLDAIAGAGENRKVDSRAVGPTALEEIASHAKAE